MHNDWICIDWPVAGIPWWCSGPIMYPVDSGGVSGECLGNGGIRDKTKRIKWFSRDYAGAARKATDTHK